MNQALKDEVAGTSSKNGDINAIPRDKSSDKLKSSWSISKPLRIGKKPRFPDTSFFAESYASSSSYGSLNDEETFIKRLTPPEL